MPRTWLVAVGVMSLLICGLASAQTVLRASYQWPDSDIRAKMIQVMAKSVEDADVDLKIQTYPAQSLFKAKEQWGALTRGRLDISAFPLDYASGRHPEFSATLMPGLVRNYDRAKRLDKSKFMDMIKSIVRDSDVRVLADAWLSGGFASKKRCITSPDTVKGQTLRAAGPAFEQMLAAAGASITSMPSSDIYTALQTGVLDAANTSTGSFISYRIYEQSKCLTAPGKNALWFMYEPVLISESSWESLNKEQQEALTAAAGKAEDYFNEKVAGLDQKMVDIFKKHDVKVVTMSEDDFNAWIKIAKKSAYKNFIDKVPNGKELIDAALSVE